MSNLICFTSARYLFRGLVFCYNCGCKHERKLMQTITHTYHHIMCQSVELDDIIAKFGRPCVMCKAATFYQRPVGFCEDCRKCELMKTPCDVIVSTHSSDYYQNISHPRVCFESVKYLHNGEVLCRNCEEKDRSLQNLPFCIYYHIMCLPDELETVIETYGGNCTVCKSVIYAHGDICKWCMKSEIGPTPYVVDAINGKRFWVAQPLHN